MNVGEALRQLEKVGPAPLYLVVGPEVYLRQGFLQRLARRMLGTGADADFGLHRLEGADPELSEVAAILRTVPLFGGRRLVIVKQWEPLTVTTAAVTKRALAALEKMLTFLTPASVLAFDMTMVEGRSKVLALVQKEALRVDCNSLQPRDAVKWLMRRAHDRGQELTGEAATMLATTVSGDLQQLERELDKVLLYVGEGRTADAAAVTAVASGSGQWRIFDLLDAVGEGRPGDALTALNHLLVTGEPPLRVLMTMARHMRQLLQVRLMTEKGLKPADINKELRVHAFVARKLQRQAAAADSRQLTKGLLACYETDLAVKTGKMTPGLAVEMLVAGLVTRRKA